MNELVTSLVTLVEVLDEQRARLEEWKAKQVQLTDALISLSA